MGATRDDFINYPRTPHLFGSQDTDDDKHFGRKGSKAFIAAPSLIVEEKVDGTNVGVHFAAGERMVLRGRGHEIMGGCIRNTISSRVDFSETTGARRDARGGHPLR